jgi:hypothetical protein
MTVQTRAYVSRIKHKHPPQPSGRLYMSAPTGSAVSIPPSVNSNDAPVKWSLKDETTLINYLIENRSYAGDGGTFQDTIWSGIVPTLEAQRTEGGVKTAKKCKEKWGRVSAKVHSF